MVERRFNWLHLSDMHAGQHLAKSRWDNVVEEKVIEDLAQVIHRSGPIDAIMFTGDLSQQGHAKELQDCREIVDRIKRSLPQEEEPLLLAVPGNHDLTRPPARGAAVKVLRGWTIDPELRDEFWTDPECDYRRVVDKAFKHWSEWAHDGIERNRFESYATDGVLPGDFAGSLRTGHLRIGVLGLNTAALQLEGGDYRGRLSLHGSQASRLVGRLGDWVRGHDACLLLTHHDDSWLDEDGREALYGQIAPPGRFVLHLCGHRHEQARTVVSEGGAAWRRTVIGRSLFGMDEYGDGAVRRHGYSVGSIVVDGGTRTFAMWPRWDVLQQAGHVEIKSDQSGTLEDGWSTTPEDLGSVPGGTPAAADRHETNTDGASWLLVDEPFLGSQVAALDSADIAEYFDGEDPCWPVVACGLVPERNPLAILLERLDAVVSAKVSTHRVLGPGGEGKTTLMMQAAARLARDSRWRVLWLQAPVSGDPRTLDWRALSSCNVEGRALCLVVDDAHEVRGQIDTFLSREALNPVLGAMRANSVHLLLCSQEDDWNRSEPRRPERWSKAGWSDAPLIVEGLSHQDALSIVSAYRAAGTMGELDPSKSDESLSRLLLELATERGCRGEAALLGALIEARTGLPLEVHVERILERSAAASRTSGAPVLQCLATVAAANAVGIHRVNARILESALDVDEVILDTAVLMAGAELHTEGLGANLSVHMRHGAIARSAAGIAFGAAPNSDIHVDKKTVFRGLGRAAVVVFPEFWRSPIACAVLDLRISLLESDPAAAVAIAEGAVEGAPDDDHCRSWLSQTYREAGELEDPAAAEETCRDYFSSEPDRMRRGSVRPLVIEWAVASGSCRELPDHGVRNLWLALLGFSDQCGDDSVQVSVARFLPTITKALELCAEQLGPDTVREGSAAVVAAAATIPGTPFLETARAMTQGSTLAIEVVPAELERLASEAWVRADERFRTLEAFPQDGKLSFRSLHDLILRTHDA